MSQTASTASTARNALVLTGTELLARLMSLALIMAVARRLGPELLGIYAFGVAFVGVLAIFTNFGLEPYIQREVGRRPEAAQGLFDQVFSLKTLIFLICAVVGVGLTFVITPPGLKRLVVWLLIAALFFQTNMGAANAFFRGLGLAQFEAYARLSSRFIYTGAGLIAVLAGLGLTLLVSLELTAAAIGCLTAWYIFSRRVARPFRHFSLAGVAGLARSAKEFLFFRVVQTVFNSIDMVMLSLMATDTKVGWYSAVVRLTAAFGFLPGALTGAFLPVLSRRGGEDSQSLALEFRPYFKYLLILGLGVAVILAGLAQKCVLFLFGPQFSQAGPTLIIMALALLLTFINWALSTAIIAVDREKQMVRIFSVAALFNILANLIAIPLYGHNGAAATTALSALLLMGLQLKVLGADLLRAMALGRLSLRPLAAGLLGLAAALGLGATAWPLIPCLILAGLAFAAALLASKTLALGEIGQLLAAAGLKRGTRS